MAFLKGEKPDSLEKSLEARSGYDNKLIPDTTLGSGLKTQLQARRVGVEGQTGTQESMEWVVGRLQGVRFESMRSMIF